MTFETIAIPFDVVDGRYFLSDRKVYENPDLLDFVKRFPNCLHRSIHFDGWEFFKDGVPDRLTNMSSTRHVAEFDKDIEITSANSLQPYKGGS